MRGLLLALLLLVVSPAVAGAEYYRVTVTRVSQDLYKTPEGLYLKTRWCYEYVYYEEAILKYDSPYSWSNEIIFVNSGGAKCDVEKVLR